VGNTRPICRIGVGTRKTPSMRRASRTSQNDQRQWDSLNSTMILSTALVTECLVWRGLRIDRRTARASLVPCYQNALGAAPKRLTLQRIRLI
jgi:hypothetical protein